MRSIRRSILGIYRKVPKAFANSVRPIPIVAPAVFAKSINNISTKSAELDLQFTTKGNGFSISFSEYILNLFNILSRAR